MRLSELALSIFAGNVSEGGGKSGNPEGELLFFGKGEGLKGKWHPLESTNLQKEKGSIEYVRVLLLLDRGLEDVDACPDADGADSGEGEEVARQRHLVSVSVGMESCCIWLAVR